MKNKILKRNKILKFSQKVLIITVMLMIFSCKNKDDTNKLKVEVKKNISIEKKTKEVIDNLNNDVKISPEKIKKYQPLINKKLVGLSIKNNKETNVYKKYWIDFYSTCMWQAPSFFIDGENKELYVFNYSENSFTTIEKEDVWVMYDIDSIFIKNEKLNIKALDTSDYHKIFFKFSHIKESSIIYKMSIKGMKESDITRYSFFTTEENSKKFEKEGCGDFDG